MASGPQPITDSPWLWAYLFTTIGLILLAVFSPKYTARQTQIEREYQGRQRAAQNVRGVAPSGELSSDGQTVIELRPLFFTLAAITTIAWIVFWWTRRAANLPATSVGPPTSALFSL